MKGNWNSMENKYDLSWEEIVYEMQNLPEFSGIIHDWFLTMNLEDNCERYYKSPEFREVMAILKKESAHASGDVSSLKLLDLAAANGIASYSFAKNNYEVHALDASPSRIVGRGAIEYIRDKYGLNIKVKQFDDRKIPYDRGFFDVVFERQFLHHTFSMEDMLKEISRVLKPGGIFIGIREHVVDNIGPALKNFYRINPIHATYGHEKAFKYSYYLECIRNSGMELVYSVKPFETEFNTFEGSFDRIMERISGTKTGKILKKILGEKITYKLGFSMIRKKEKQGRLYGFVAKKK
jgi:ubiquinone/menaquinone biosynthesis C-methylase UbiE